MKLIIELRRDEFARLDKLARAERRTPQDQAAVLIAQALKTATPKDAEPVKAAAGVRPQDVE